MLKNLNKKCISFFVTVLLLQDILRLICKMEVNLLFVLIQKRFHATEIINISFYLIVLKIKKYHL
jgi:hypothetical protein